jgi:hypothetical protein
MELGVLLEELEAPALLCWSGRFRFILRINQNDVFRSCGSLLRLLRRFGLRVWCLLSAAHFDLVGSVVCGVLGVGLRGARNFNCGSVVHDDRPSIEGCDVSLREGERMGGFEVREEGELEKDAQFPVSPKFLLTGGVELLLFFPKSINFSITSIKHLTYGIKYFKQLPKLI